MSTFLEDLYAEKNEDTAMQMIYKNLYECRIAKNYQLLDHILHDVDVSRLSVPLLVAILTVTAPVKTLERASFYNRSREAIVNLRGEVATRRILVGLE